jgi:non-ribosomal peptide synthetase component F
MLGEDERAELVAGWGDTTGEGPAPGCVHLPFEEQAAATPDSIALTCGDATLTYGELNRRANQVAHALRRKGVGPEVLVGLCVDRNVEMVVGLLGILKAGGAYVPLDPTYPESRLAWMLEDARAPVLLTQDSVASVLPPFAGEVIRLDADASEIAKEPEANPPTTVTSANLAYVIYTSGSTGKPKGVTIRHASAAGLVQWSRGVYEDDDLRCVLASTSICFDLSVFEILVPLSRGGSILLVEDALALADHPDRNRVTLINTVPSAIQALVRGGTLPPSVRTVNLAGEPLSHVLDLRAAGARRSRDDRATDRRRARVRGRPVAGARAPRRTGRAPDRWRGPVPRLPGTSRPDGREVRPGSVRGGGPPGGIGEDPVPHGRPGALPAGRQPGVPRAPRRADQAARVPHRAR